MCKNFRKGGVGARQALGTVPAASSPRPQWSYQHLHCVTVSHALTCDTRGPRLGNPSAPKGNPALSASAAVPAGHPWTPTPAPLNWV